MQVIDDLIGEELGYYRELVQEEGISALLE
jgi:hypothetical protein